MISGFKFYRARPEYVIQTDAPVVCYVVGETGFYPIRTNAKPDDLNWDGTTDEILESAEAGSMFGWDAPSAALALDFAKECIAKHNNEGNDNG